MSGLRVLVCGGRDFESREQVFEVLHDMACERGWLTIIQGGASGADHWAREWATRHYHGLVAVPADWRKYGRSAGPMRNEQMLVSGKPDLVIAFPGGRGTADIIRRARTAGIEVLQPLSPTPSHTGDET